MASLSDLLGADWRRHARLLTLTTPAGLDALLAESVRIDEALGPVAGHAGFRIELTALAPDGGPSLTGLIGEPLRLDLQLADSCNVPRPFHGHVTQTNRLGASDGLARYRLIVEPWLAFLGRNRDSDLFQDKTVIDIVDEVFAGWRTHDRLEPAWRWDLADPAAYPRRSMCVQYGESDLAFVRRLLVEEGLCCHFEHEAGEGGSLGRHILVISDHRDAFRAHAGPVAGCSLVSASLVDDGLVPDAVARGEVLGAALRHFDGEGTLRWAAPGARLVLEHHPQDRSDATEAGELLITAVHHQAHNSLAESPPERLVALGQLEPWDDAEGLLVRSAGFYRNRLVAQPATLSWRPPAKDAAGRPLYPRPDAARPLTAIVVGPDSSSPSDGSSHIRVQFSWPRSYQPAGGRGQRGFADSAVDSDIRGAWLRVVTPVARPDRAWHLTPRPGQEVLVAFLHGNPDRPVVVGALSNDQGNPLAPDSRKGSVALTR